MVRVSATALLCACICACIANPRGQCATDADCAGGAPGSFCAEGVCQGLPRGTVDAFGARTFARADIMRVRIHVERSHGTATARVLSGDIAVAAAQALPDGTLAAGAEPGDNAGRVWRPGDARRPLRSASCPE